MKRFGLIGYPLTHSFSKKYFSEKFEKEGLSDHLYELFPLKSIDEFPGVLQANPDLVGLNVTIPYKQQVTRFLTRSFLPEGVNACNCIRIDNGALEGFNTDITGFEKSFVPQLRKEHRKALVLGNGGATAAVVFVLNKLGIPFEVVSRAMHGGSTMTYDQVDEKIIKDHLVIINTTPLGMAPDTEKCADIPYQYINPQHYLYDLVYNPDKTLFLKKGEERGAVIKNGYDMLIFQAEENWRIWNREAEI